MLDFPSNPIPNDVFNPGGGTVWKWDGSKWVAVPGGIGDAPSDSKVYARKNATWADITGVPIAFTIAGKPAASASLVVPMAVVLVIPASLAGSRAYTQVAATAAAAFTLNKIAAAGGTTALGTVTMNAGANTFALAGAGGSLAAGDTLQLVAPATQDATLADLGITILAARV